MNSEAFKELQSVLNNQKTITTKRLKRLIDGLDFKPHEELKKGDHVTADIKVLKQKKGSPTKIYFNGNSYALVHDDYINGNKNKFGR